MGSDGVNEHNTTQIIPHICSIGHHGYNYFQVRKDVASIRGRSLNRGVYSSKHSTYYTHIIMGINTVLCVLTLCVLQ